MDFRTSYSDGYQTQEDFRSLVSHEPSIEISNSILNALSPEMRTTLTPSLKPVQLKREQFLYQQEDRLNYLYFPETAVVSELKILEDGRMVEIAIIGKEGAVGLSSLCSDTHFASSCMQVSQAGTAQRVDFETFEKVVRSNAHVRTSVGHFLDIYVRQISQKAVCNMYHSVKERLCTWLLMLQDRSGRRVLNLTHEQIAKALGVYRPSITCIAMELRASHLIDYTRGGISITDRPGTEWAACSCYAELTAFKPAFVI